VTEHGLTDGDTRTALITGGVAPQERDIDVVLVTGAGASRAFGVNGKPLPLMAAMKTGAASIAYANAPATPDHAYAEALVTKNTLLPLPETLGIFWVSTARRYSSTQRRAEAGVTDHSVHSGR
jgi:hypothetical protein